jgi:predicted small secreted protein
MRVLLRRFALLSVLLGTFASLAACENTFEGAGEDIEEMGDEAEEVTQ